MPVPDLFPIAKSITKLPLTWREAKSDTVVSVPVKVQNFDKYSEFNWPSAAQTIAERQNISAASL